MRKVLIILTLVGIVLTTGICLNNVGLVKAETRTTIMDSCTTNHSVGSDFYDETSNHTELSSDYISGNYTFDYGLTPTVKANMFLIGGLNSYRNVLISVMYSNAGNPYASYNNSTTDADTDGDGNSDSYEINLNAVVKDSLFVNFGHVETNYDSYYNGGLGSRISSWTVLGE